MQDIFFKCARLVRRWHVIQSEEVSSQLECLAKDWERRGAMPTRLSWVQQAPSSMVLPVPIARTRVHEFSMSPDSGAVIDSTLFVSSEPDNLLSSGAQIMLDPMGCAEHVFTV
jgi:hypothetical protein